MKIRAYPLLHQEGQAPRAGEKKESSPATRRSLPLLQDTRCYEETEICETLRARVRTYLAQLHKAQSDLSAIQGGEQHLAEAEKLYQQVGQFLAGEKSEQGKNMELLYLSLGRVREKLAKLSSQPAGTLDPADPAKVRGKKDDSACPAPNELETEISHLSAELELARQKLTTRQQELVAVIAHNLVAVENIVASSSAIRDPANARKVMAEVRDKLTYSTHNHVLAQANRENIATLLR